MTKAEFIKLTGQDPEDMFGGDWQEVVEDIKDCEHMCTSNCRREGCNCKCGEYHLELTNNNV